MSNKVINKISELSESVLATTDFFLVDVEIKGGDIPEVWVSVDGEERGVNMDECADISNEISFLMDAHELFSGRYRINVSSPGLDRPLVDRRQYPKNKGRKVKVKYEQGGEDLRVEGTLQDISEQGIIVEINEQTTVTLPFDDLVETKIIPSFK
ncbi:ribosome maturation factor RimP [Fodinibius salsisoli]|uniref:Ribosome maturation factor RimP n=1 Tax=Fodinibius salsisoli TaxID=2820877 RepID=A0ABT3PST2_9BACT|nr:ribosome maturation factor [Fodinibius salsisoli]